MSHREQLHSWIDKYLKEDADLEEFVEELFQWRNRHARLVAGNAVLKMLDALIQKYQELNTGHQYDKVIAETQEWRDQLHEDHKKFKRHAFRTQQ